MKRIWVILSLLLAITACTNQAAEVDSTPLETTNTAVQEEIEAPAALPVVVVEIEPTAVPTEEPAVATIEETVVEEMLDGIQRPRHKLSLKR